MSEHANDYPSVDAPDAVSCDVDGAFHHSKRGREEGRVSEGKSFFGSTMESKESEEKREKSTCRADRAAQVEAPP